MKMLAWTSLLALVAVGVPVASPAQSPATADTRGKTAAGVSYTQPKDWSLTTSGASTSFNAPEGNLGMIVVEVGEVADASAAAAKAWALYKPAMTRPVQLVTAAGSGNGWDERTAIVYETSPSEKAALTALALRNGKAWTVVLTDGALSTLNKRSAAVTVIQQSLRPAGYQRESFAGKVAHRLTAERVQALRDFLTQSARELGVPGVGVALIDQGKVVWQGGIGVRELGKSEPVDEHTKFMIASNTKGMATLLLSVLADEGKLRWDERVVDLYPGFRLGGDETTRATLVRHLVCACTGLPRKDLQFILAEKGLPATDTFVQLSKTQPTSKFGELYQYNNLMASAAGYLGGMVAYPGMELGAAFDKAMQTRIFDPLGMHETTMDYAKAMSGNWARPHGLDIDGHVTEISNDFNFTVIPYRPAGGGWSTAADMARYVQLELSKGLTPEGKRLVSERNILERRKPGVPINEDSNYGMGLSEGTLWGVPAVWHGGALQGYHSNFYVLPEAGVGAVILTNADPGMVLPLLFARRLMEVLYDGKPEAARDVTAAAARIKAQAQAHRARLDFPGDATVLAGLAGTYRHPEAGPLTITEKDGAKYLKAGFVEGPLATRKNVDGSMSIVSVAPGYSSIEAVVGNQNGARTLTVRDAQHEYVFVEAR